MKKFDKAVKMFLDKEIGVMSGYGRCPCGCYSPLVKGKCLECRCKELNRHTIDKGGPRE